MTVWASRQHEGGKKEPACPSCYGNPPRRGGTETRPLYGLARGHMPGLAFRWLGATVWPMPMWSPSGLPLLVEHSVAAEGVSGGHGGVSSQNALQRIP